MAALMLVNPRKRRKSKKSKTRTRTIVKYRSRKAPKKRVRRRRNPIKLRGIQGTVMNSVKNGAIGSVGAIAGTLVGNLLPIPENLKEGNMGIIVDALIGIGTGILVAKVTNKKVGEMMAQGAVTVALHGTMKSMISTAVPSLNLGGYDEDGLLGMHDDSLLGMGEYAAMGEYDSTMGYAGAGTTSALDEYGDDEYTDGGLDW